MSKAEEIRALFDEMWRTFERYVSMRRSFGDCLICIPHMAVLVLIPWNGKYWLRWIGPGQSAN